MITRDAYRLDYLGAVHTDAGRGDGVLAVRDERTGFLHVDARPARTGVQQYADGDGEQWGELRTPEQVFSAESLDSYRGAIVTDDHPQAFVTAANVRSVQVGHAVSDARRDGEQVAQGLVITDPETIAKIDAGKVELSAGYWSDVVADAGINDAGEAYSHRQTNIRINHIAIVDQGRAGPQCRLMLDGARVPVHHPGLMPAKTLAEGKPAPGKTDRDKAAEDHPMETKTIKIDGAEYTVPTEVAAALENQRADAKAADAAQPDPPGAGPEAHALQAKVDALQEQIRTSRAGESARIDARVRLVADARIVKPSIDIDGRTDAEIMREIVIEVSPGLESKIDARKDSPGYLLASFEHACETHGRNDAAANRSASIIFDKVEKTDAEGPGASYASMLSRFDFDAADQAGKGSN